MSWNGGVNSELRWLDGTTDWLICGCAGMIKIIRSAIRQEVGKLLRLVEDDFDHFYGWLMSR